MSFGLPLFIKLIFILFTIVFLTILILAIRRFLAMRRAAILATTNGGAANHPYIVTNPGATGIAVLHPSQIPGSAANNQTQFVYTNQAYFPDNRSSICATAPPDVGNFAAGIPGQAPGPGFVVPGMPLPPPPPPYVEHAAAVVPQYPGEAHYPKN